jgi:hypothetical protein
MSAQELTKYASGVLGISQATGTDIAVIIDPGKGRYQVWGVVRHTLADGCRLLLGASIIIPFIPAGPNLSEKFGPVVLDILNNTDDIILELAAATGGADSASGIVYAQKLYPL